MKKMNIGFIGFGLIGGSIAKTLKMINKENYIIAYDYYSEKNDNSYNPNLKCAYDDGIINNIVTDLGIFSDCDLIYLCAPVKTNIKYLKCLKPIITENCIITDVGSVKGDIHKEVEQLGMDYNFVGGHPMAGSEKSGYANSSSTLLENAYYMITSGKNTPVDKINFLANITSEIGAIPIKVDYTEHDLYVAAISHVPHVIAVCLVNMVKTNDTTGIMKLIAAGGFKDITRIGSSSPVMWENICLNNKDSILEYLTKFKQNIDEAYTYIENSDGKSINKIFESSKEYRDSIENRSGKKIITSFYELYVDKISDTKGIIASIATLLASNDINIKNIGIENNREHTKGVLRIEFKEEAEQLHAQLLLEKENYNVYIK